METTTVVITRISAAEIFSPQISVAEISTPPPPQIIRHDAAFKLQHKPTPSLRQNTP